MYDTHVMDMNDDDRYEVRSCVDILVQGLSGALSHYCQVVFPLFQLPLEWTSKRLERFAPFLDLSETLRRLRFRLVDTVKLDTMAR